MSVEGVCTLKGREMNSTAASQPRPTHMIINVGSLALILPTWLFMGLTWIIDVLAPSTLVFELFCASLVLAFGLIAFRLGRGSRTPFYSRLCLVMDWLFLAWFAALAGDMIAMLVTGNSHLLVLFR